MLEAFQQSKKKTIRNWPGFLKWLAVRRGIDRIREKQRNRLRIDATKDIGLVAISHSSNSSSLELQELQTRIKTELTLLPDSQAEAFWLRFIEQMNYSEIAEQMNIESQAVGVLIHRARTHVRQAIADLQQPVGERNE
jgi:RNA polymerase sigma factor (sigma-70 family)